MPVFARQTHLNLASLLAEQNPTINFKLNAYEVSTSTFLKAVSSYVNRAIAEITKQRNTQEGERKKLIEKAQAAEVEINECKVREIDLIAALSKEQDEKREYEQSIAALRRQFASLREKCASVDIEIEQYRATAANLRREKAGEHDTLRAYASTVHPRLAACETQLRCTIEGIENDQLLIRFSCLLAADVDREFSLVIDMSSRMYKVITVTPTLLHLPILIQDLNSTRDIYHFIKETRSTFLIQVGE